MCERAVKFIKTKKSWIFPQPLLFFLFRSHHLPHYAAIGTSAGTGFTFRAFYLLCAFVALRRRRRQRRQWAPVWMSHWRAIVYSTTRIRARANEYINKWLFFSLAFFRFAPCLLSHRCFSIFVGALWARTRSMKWKEQTHLMNERLVRLGAHARLESGYKESGTFNNAFYEYARVTRKHDSAFNEQSERCASQYCAKAGQSHVDGKAAK